MDPGVRRDDEGAVVAPLEDARLGFYVAARRRLLIARRDPTPHRHSGGGGNLYAVRFRLHRWR
jgi:hypothetical protein